MAYPYLIFAYIHSYIYIYNKSYILDTLLSIETNFTSVVVDAKGAKLTGALTFTMFGLLIAVIIILDIITFPRQIGFFKVFI